MFIGLSYKGLLVSFAILCKVINSYLFCSLVDDTDVVDNWDWKSYDINLNYNGKVY